MKIRRSTLALVLLAGLFAYESPAQTDIEQSPEGKKVLALQDELTRISGDIDAGVENMLDLIIPLTDSLDTGNKVTKLKQDAMDGLRKTIDFYVLERQKLEGSLAQQAPALTKEQMADQVGQLDDKIDQRINEILRISTSLAEHKEVEKYDYEYNYYSDHYNQSTSEEYKQNLKVQRRVVDSKEKLYENLEKSISAMKERLNRYERLLGYQVSEENAAAIQQLINETGQRISERESQLQSIVSPSENSPGKQAIGDKEFKIVMKMIKDQKAEIASSYNLLRRVKSEYDTALIRYNNARRLQNF